MGNKHSENLPRGFLPLMALAMVVLWFCYQLVLSTVKPGTATALVWLLALLGAATFYALLVLSARVGSGEQGERTLATRAKIGACFLLLYTCSGYGISSAYMLLFEGPNILREHIDTSLRSYATLRAVAERDLPVQEYQAVVNRVRSSQSGLLREITSPSGGNYCGVGRNAQRYIREIAQDLPGFAVLSGTNDSHNCDDTLLMNRIVDAYVKDIDERLRNHRLAAEKGVAARLKVLTDVRTASDGHAAALNAEAARLSAIGNLVFNFGLFSQASVTVQRAAADYDTLHQSLKKVDAAVAAAVPPTIDVTALRQVISGFDMPTVLFDRLNKIVTWVAFLLPFFGDLAYVRLARAVLEKYRKLLRAAQDMTVGDTDVSYLLRPLA